MKAKAFTKGKGLSTVLFIAAGLMLLIALLWQLRGGGDAVKTAEDREKFLREYGWEIDISREEFCRLTIPDTLDAVLGQYNQLQLEQGWDLNKYLGKKCEQYSYPVTNYPDCADGIYATLFVYKGKVIAGDIHSAQLDGFMHGISVSGE